MVHTEGALRRRLVGKRDGYYARRTCEIGVRRCSFFWVRRRVRTRLVGEPVPADPYRTDPAAFRVLGRARSPFIRTGAADDDSSEGGCFAALLRFGTPDWRGRPAPTNQAV